MTNPAASLVSSVVGDLRSEIIHQIIIYTNNIELYDKAVKKTPNATPL